MPIDTTPKSGKQIQLWIMSNIIAVLFLFALIELAIVLLMRFPPPFEPILRVLSSYYTEHDRRIVQALPECAIYDPLLAYTLRVGGCRFANRDFDTEVRANSLGLRDSETRLTGPEIIALGDSVTMGWGVAIEETFPKLIERQCGLDVLNAGVSSYGTVRETRLLQRLDLSRLKTLLIQYSNNDFDENKHFYENDNTMKVMDEAEFVKMQLDHVRSTRYFFGAHTVRFTPFLFEKISSRLEPLESRSDVAKQGAPTENLADAHARHFFNALLNAETPLPDVDILVFEINGRTKNDNAFARALTSLLERERRSGLAGRIQVLDISQGLTNDNFFVLDDHVNQRGHRHIAEHLANRLGCTAGG